MVDALSQLVFCWRQIGYGMRLNSTLYTHVYWSDNWWLFVHKRAHLFQMIQSLTFVLYARRLKWKPDSLSFTASSSGVDRPEIDLDSRRASFKIEAGQGFVLNDSLQSPDPSLRKRLHLYSTRIVLILLYGAGPRVLTHGLVQRLKSWEGLTVKRIMRVCQKPRETFVQWMRRSIQAAHKCLQTYKIEPLTIRALDRIYGFAVVLAREAFDETTRFVRAVHMWKDTTWWVTMREVGEEHDKANKSLWRHGRRGRPRPRWDAVLVDHFGDEWKHVLKASNDFTPSAKKQRFHDFARDAFTLVIRHCDVFIIFQCFCQHCRVVSVHVQQTMIDFRRSTAEIANPSGSRRPSPRPTRRSIAVSRDAICDCAF